MNAINIKNTSLVAIIIGLMTTNFLSITSAPFHASVYQLISNFPYEALLKNSPMMKQKLIEIESQKILKQNQELISKLNAHQAALGRARHVTQRIVKRTAKNVATNVGSIIGEALPYVGVASIIGVTALDIKDGCDTVRDVNEMISLLEIEPIEDDESRVCGTKVPTLSEIKLNIDGTIDSAKTKVTEQVDAIEDTLKNRLTDIWK